VKSDDVKSGDVKSGDVKSDDVKDDVYWNMLASVGVTWVPNFKRP